MSKRIKYIHIGCIIAGLLLPLVPVIAVMADFVVAVGSNEFLIRNNVTFLSGGLGFVSLVASNQFCDTFNKETLFYILLVPIVFSAIGTVFLVLIIWRIQLVSQYYQYYYGVWCIDCVRNYVCGLCVDS